MKALYPDIQAAPSGPQARPKTIRGQPMSSRASVPSLGASLRLQQTPLVIECGVSNCPGVTCILDTYSKGISVKCV